MNMEIFLTMRKKESENLLLHKSEIAKLRKQKEEKGLTIVALSMYFT